MLSQWEHLQLVILSHFCPLDAFFHSNHGQAFQAYNFLNIQPIFNPQKFWKAETQGFPTIVSMVCHVKSMEVSTAGDSG